MKRTTIRLGKEYQTAQSLAARFGLNSSVSALRLSLRVVAESLPAIDPPTQLRGEAGAPRTLLFDDADIAAAEKLIAHYGLKNFSAAARVAIYLVAEQGLRVREN